MIAETSRPGGVGRRALIKSGALWLLAGAMDAPRLLADRPPGSTNEPVLRIGLLTDLHYADRPPAGTRFYRETLPKLRECVTRFNAASLDLAVELGDFIDAAESVEVELGYLKTIETEFARVRCPRHYVLGNHCVWTLSKEQFSGNCGAGKPFYSFDQAGFHFIILDACFRADGTAYGARNFVWTDTDIPAMERDWLEKDLQTARGKVIVFVHQRLDVENEYGVKSAPAVRSILEKSGKVLAVFQGHYHQNEHREIQGVHYCTLAAMIEGAEDNAYGVLSVYKDGALKLEGFRRQTSYALPGGA